MTTVYKHDECLTATQQGTSYTVYLGQPTAYAPRYEVTLYNDGTSYTQRVSYDNTGDIRRKVQGSTPTMNKVMQAIAAYNKGA